MNPATKNNNTVNEKKSIKYRERLAGRVHQPGSNPAPDLAPGAKLIPIHYRAVVLGTGSILQHLVVHWI